MLMPAKSGIICVCIVINLDCDNGEKELAVCVLTGIYVDNI